MKVTTERFDEYHGREVKKYTITTDDMVFAFLDFGAALHSVMMPDKEGRKKNVVIGFSTAADYVESGGFYGMTLGRVAGRIAHGTFELNGETYHLAKNLGDHHLHGGGTMSYRVYDTEVSVREDGSEIALIMTTEVKSAEDHYPGNMRVQVTHTVNDQNAWTVHYQAVTDEDTLFNPSNHSYFNLNGMTGDVTGQLLTINSQQVAETDDELIPTGRLLVPDVDYSTEQRVAAGLDTPYVLAGDPDDVRITLRDDDSGRRLDIKTDRPAVIVYSAGGVDFTASDGFHVGDGAAIALETQVLPDAINKPELGEVRVLGSETFQSSTSYYFSIEK
ncbi:aldose epimerase family protein [Macrococcus equipercicus]|uniref:Galactose mutarotase n=1 Tax=Macrococcus equipercicus TaxID=69967 RepID=A0A9Q9BN85_9STAP|nr:aldose epimerase family protein [Macrococcus equipercicus]UTH13620.1 galactose mutarotase [Macrococcus equipercicus]